MLFFAGYRSCNKPSKMSIDWSYDTNFLLPGKGKAENISDNKVKRAEETGLPAIQCMALLPEQPQLSISEEDKNAVTNLLDEYTQPRLPLTQYKGSDVVSDSR